MKSKWVCLLIAFVILVVFASACGKESSLEVKQDDPLTPSAGPQVEMTSTASPEAKQDDPLTPSAGPQVEMTSTASPEAKQDDPLTPSAGPQAEMTSTASPEAKQDDPLALSASPQAELIFTASDYVWTLSSDGDGNLYVLTDGGVIFRIDQDGNSEEVYAGLDLCGFSRRVMTVLPGGEIVVNDCVDETDTLVQIDQEGRATTLLELQDSILSLSSDPDGNVYVGTWTSEGNISLNYNPTHLGGADNIAGQVSKLLPDNTLTRVYEGGIPVALACGEEGSLMAAIWGQSGPFRPEQKEYSVCSYLGLFWIGMSDQVKLVQLANGQADQIIAESLNSVSAITMGKDRVMVVGMHGSDPCGLYLVETGQEPLGLTFSDDEIDDNIMGLTKTGKYVYFADVNGNVYRLSSD